MLKLEWDEDLEKITQDFVEKCELSHNKQRHQLFDRMTTTPNGSKLLK